MAEIDQATQRLIASALQKERAGQVLSREELSALKKFRRDKEDRDRLLFYATVPQKHYEKLSGRQRKILKDQQKTYGLPCGEAVVDLNAVIRWFHDLLAKNHHKLLADDPLMGGPPSKAQERYRLAQAKRAEFALDRDLRQSRTIGEIEKVWNVWDQSLRQACESIQRGNLAGVEAVEQIREVMESALKSLDGLVERERMEDHIDGGEGDSSSTSTTCIAG